MTAQASNAVPSAASPDNGRLLEVIDLTVAFPTRRGTIHASNGTTLSISRGRTLGLVGESGSGKSVTLRALIGLVPAPGRIVRGRVMFEGTDLVQASPGFLRGIRGKAIAMIFQDPTACLNPVHSVGDQLRETLRQKVGLDGREAVSRAEELIHQVGIRPARGRMDAFPHQLSGGMAQRVMIALAICANPTLLLADEPTTALDVSVQDQILSLLEDLRLETGMAMLIVSHDLGVIARACDDVAVMYAGRLLERGTVSEVLRQPRHPYTQMLIATLPSLRPNVARTPLPAIAGQLPDLLDVIGGCPFAPRCTFVRPECGAVPVALDAPSPGHGSSCPFV